MVIEFLAYTKSFAIGFLDETPRAIASQIVRYFKSKLFPKTKQGAVVYRSMGRPTTSTPQIWFAIEHLFKLRRYEELYLVGVAAERDGLRQHCPSPEFERALIMTAIAAYSKQTPDYELARTFLEASSKCMEHDEIRLRANVNLCQLHILRKKFELADYYVSIALDIRESSDIALVNSLCVASRMRNRSKCATRAQLVLAHHPDADDPETFLGEQLLMDPDLEYFRSSGLFGKHFPNLANAAAFPSPMAVSTVPVIILIGLVSVLVVWGSVQAAISVGG